MAAAGGGCGGRSDGGGGRGDRRMGIATATVLEAVATALGNGGSSDGRDGGNGGGGGDSGRDAGDGGGGDIDRGDSESGGGSAAAGRRYRWRRRRGDCYGRDGDGNGGGSATAGDGGSGARVDLPHTNSDPAALASSRRWQRLCQKRWRRLSAASAAEGSIGAAIVGGKTAG